MILAKGSSDSCAYEKDVSPSDVCPAFAKRCQAE